MPPRPHDNCYWVVPGQLMAGEYPGAKADALARPRLAQIAAAGIRHFVDLTEVGELVPYDHLLSEIAVERGLSMSHARRGIRDVDVPRSAAYANDILDHLDAMIAAEAVPYVHCLGGVGRTGTIIGCWLVRHGHSGEEALKTIADLWTGMSAMKRTKHPASPQTEAQRRFVLGWSAHDRVRTATPATD
jgi:hypothetical protein